MNRTPIETLVFWYRRIAAAFVATGAVFAALGFAVPGHHGHRPAVLGMAATLIIGGAIIAWATTEEVEEW